MGSPVASNGGEAGGEDPVVSGSCLRLDASIRLSAPAPVFLSAPMPATSSVCRPTRKDVPVVPPGARRSRLHRPRGRRAGPMGRAPRLRAVGGAPSGRRAVGVLRGSTDGERPARPPPRVGPGVQGPVLPVPDHAGLRRPPQGGLGHPRPARRGGGGEAARHHGQGPDRVTGGHRRVHPAVPRVGAQLRRRVEEPDRAHRLLDRHRRCLLDVLDRVRRGGVVEPQEPLDPGAALRGHQGGALLPAVRDRPEQPRARPARRVPRGGRRVRLRAAPGIRRGPGGRPAAPDPRAGLPRRPLAGGVDHHPVDAALQHRGGRRGRPRLRGGRRPGRGRRSGARGVR